MTHELKIIQGSTEIDFSSSGYRIENYVPSTPSKLNTTVDYSLADGGDITNIRYRNVEETAIIYFDGNLQSKINEVEQVFDNLKLYRNKRIGDKTYVTFKPSGDSVAYRSELLEASLTLVDTTMEYYANDSSEVILTWVRRYYWEGPETEIPLNNPNVGPKATGGISVENDLDGSLYNYVDIEDSDVDGVLPAPVKITITRTDTGDEEFITKWFASNNVFGDPFNYNPILQGEDADNLDASPSSSTESGGAYGRVDTSSGPAIEQCHTWDLSKTQVDRMAGRSHRIIAKMTFIFTSRALHARLYKEVNSNSVLLGRTSEKIQLNLSDQFTDLGSMRFPPGLLGGDQGGLRLDLWARTPTGQSASLLGVDCIFVYPEDSFLYLRQLGLGFDETDTLTINGYDDTVFMTKSDDFSVFSLVTDYLYVWPNKNQRIHFNLFSGTSSYLEIVSDVQIWYRPRRLTI